MEGFYFPILLGEEMRGLWKLNNRNLCDGIFLFFSEA
jgi:hypothetical protein